MMQTVIFGPVPSRRLGRSLGVNVVPPKICSLNCVYCEAGKTNNLTMKRAPYIPAEVVLKEFHEKYPLVKDKTDVITVTGAGEPTLNSDLPRILSGIKEISDHPVAILTNSTTMPDAEVRQELAEFDIVVPSLDALNQDVFRAVDKPEPSLNITEISEALTSFSQSYKGRLFLELLLVKGVNDAPEDLERFINAAKNIKCEKIQLGTVFRPPAWKGVERLGERELEEAYLKLAKAGLNVEPVGVFAGRIGLSKGAEQIESFLEGLLRMRPVTLSDIAAGLEISVDEASRLLEQIRQKNILNERLHNGELYYGI